MSCVKVFSRLSPHWRSRRRRSCRLMRRTSRSRPRHRRLKRRPPLSHLRRWQSFPGRSSQPVRRCGGAAIGVVAGDRSVRRSQVSTGARRGGEFMEVRIGAAGTVGAATAVTGSITADRSKIVSTALATGASPMAMRQGRRWRLRHKHEMARPGMALSTRVARPGRAECVRGGLWEFSLQSIFLRQSSEATAPECVLRLGS
jgi:hypothetical protein